MSLKIECDNVYSTAQSEERKRIWDGISSLEFHECGKKFYYSEEDLRSLIFGT